MGRVGCAAAISCSSIRCWLRRATPWRGATPTAVRATASVLHRHPGRLGRCRLRGHPRHHVGRGLRTVRLCERRAVGHRRGQLRRLSRQLGAGPHRSLSGGGVGSQRLQPHGTWGTSDIGPGREFEFGGGPPWETIDWYLKQSPISYLGNAKTPTLVVHSARDYRCPIEQGEALYLSLQFLGVPTELVRFPDEGHELSRSGKPWHRVFRLEKYVEWFGKWLKGDDEMMG
ncbi:MAG: prolyl oligopeptidase family serine peptidase [Caldilineaceae bacterium]